MNAQLIESSPVEPLVVGVNLFPGDTWFREIRVVSTTSQQSVDLSEWAFEAKLGGADGTVDVSRAAEGVVSVTFSPSVTASAKRGTQLTIAGTLAGGRRTFVVGRVGAEVGSSIPVGLVQRKRVVSTDVDISVYAAMRGDKGEDGTAISQALVEKVETDRKAAGTSAFNAGASAAAAQSSEEEAQRAEGVAVEKAEQARVYAAGTVALQDAAVSALLAGDTVSRQRVAGVVTLARPLRSKRVWAVGDSNTLGAGAGGGGLSYDNTLFTNVGQPCILYNGGSWTTWALLASQAQWTIAGVFATGGWTAAQILAVHVPAVIAAAKPGDTVVVTAGTNGNVLADVIAVHEALRAAGLNTVAVTIPPSTAAGVALVARVNSGLDAYARERGIPIADVHGVLVDPATGATLAAYNGDGVHPNQAGMQLWGSTVAAVLNPLFPPGRLVQHNATVPGQLQPKPLALGAPTAGVEFARMGSAGTSTATVEADADFAGGYCYQFLRGDAGLDARMFSPMQLVAGNRMRLGFAIKTDNQETGASWALSFESSTTGAKQLFKLGHSALKRNVGISRLFVEFVVPTLPDYGYRLKVSTFAVPGARIRLGELALQDLTLMEG